MNYWLVKSEPYVYSWDQLENDGTVVWDGIRNYASRNNLMAMKKGDLVFYYHSNEGLEITGICKVSKEYFQDPGTDDKNWVAVQLKPFKRLRSTVSLKDIKSEPRLKDMQLLKLSRHSVTAVKKEEFDIILEMSNRK